MQHLCNLWIWLFVTALHHTAHTRVPGLTRERAFVSGINTSPLLNDDRNEVDILLDFVGEPPLPPTSVYTKAFSSATSSTTSTSVDRPSRPQADRSLVGSMASKTHPQDHSKAGKSRRLSTDAVVDNVLQAYKRVLDKTVRGSLQCKNGTTLLLRALCALWARQVVDSVRHCSAPPSTRKSLANYIVKNVLSEEHLFVPENDWSEHLEDVLCTCYYAIVKTVTDTTRCHECEVIIDEIVFAFLVEDLLTDILSSEQKTYVTDAVGRLLDLSGISNKKQSVWEALSTGKQNLRVSKKIHIDGKKTSKQSLHSERSFVAAIFGDTVINGGEKSRWERSPSHIISKGNEKRSIPFDYEEFLPFGESRLPTHFYEYEAEISHESFDLEKNGKQSSLEQSYRSLETAGGAHIEEYSVEDSEDLLSTEREYFDQPVSPVRYDVTFTSADYQELTMIIWMSPSEDEDRRSLKWRKKRYQPQLTEKKSEFDHESRTKEMKMLKGHKTNDGSNFRFSLNQEPKGQNKNKSSLKEGKYDEGDSKNVHVNLFTDLEGSPFVRALGRWTQFPETIKASGRVASTLGSNTDTPHVNNTNSSSASKLPSSEGNQRTAKTARPGDPRSNLIRKSRQAALHKIALLDIFNELGKKGNVSQGNEETGNEQGASWSAPPGTNRTSEEHDAGDQYETFLGGLVGAVVDFLSKIPKNIADLGL